jgi:hypothetical protein
VRIQPVLDVLESSSSLGYDLTGDQYTCSLS